MIKLCKALLSAFLITACSTSADKERPSPSSLSTDEEGSSKRFVVDKEAPASFEDYKKWRKENAPNEEVYAEYKQWEAAYKQWLKTQTAE
jgi:hypothetical protein